MPVKIFQAQSIQNKQLQQMYILQQIYNGHGTSRKKFVIKPLANLFLQNFTKENSKTYVILTKKSILTIS